MKTSAAARTQPVSSYDEALTVLAEFGPYLKIGFANHAPMVVEAVHHMRRPQAILRWLKPELEEMIPLAKNALFISSEHWESYLGNRKAYAAWTHYFQEQIAEHGSHKTIGDWVERLQLGYVADATHGIIRVGHIARAIQEVVTPARLTECANALAYWASCYSEPDFAQDAPNGNQPAHDVFRQLALVPESRRDNGGAVSTALANVKYAEGFYENLPRVDLSGDIDARVLELATLFASLFLTSATTHITCISLAHALTSLAAVLSLRPFITNCVARKLLRRAWETGAALHVAYSPSTDLDVSFGQVQLSPEETIDAAVQHGDDHVIKLTDACLTFYDLSGDPIFLRVAQHSRNVSPVRRS